MRSRVQVWLLLLLAPVLAIGTSDGAYSLFHCAFMGTLQRAPCCANVGHEQPDDQLDATSCCDQQVVQVHASDQELTRDLSVSSTRVAVTRLRLVDLWAPERELSSFAVLEAPRAIGPPLILLTRQLLL